MANVKFLYGSSTAYAALESKDSYTFYYTTDDGNLYLGTRLLSNEDAIEALEEAVGTLDDLSTTTKTDLVAAINEVYTAVGTGGTEAVVTITEDTTSSEYAKVYTFSQGGTSIGTINIPKDLVVESGTVETNPEGQEEGTYIVLTLANSDDTQIYINVGDLVDIYTAASDATQIQVTVDNDTREISAAIVAGSVGTTELADASVTLAKLSTSVQESLALADSAVQSVTAGTANGTISVDGADVSVTGLGSAAYTDSSAYEAAGSIAALDYTDTETDGQYVSAVSETDGVIAVTRASLPDYSTTYDAYGAANTAESNANSYTDEAIETALTWTSFEG